MLGALVDSNVLLDIFTADAKWLQWSQDTLDEYAETHTLFINEIIYAEISIGFKSLEELERALQLCAMRYLVSPKEGLFLAGKAYKKYRQQGGQKRSTIPDFFIGAHAAVSDLTLITRDKKHYQFYFPKLSIVSP